MIISWIFSKTWTFWIGLLVGVILILWIFWGGKSNNNNQFVGLKPLDPNNNQNEQVILNQQQYNKLINNPPIKVVPEPKPIVPHKRFDTENDIDNDNSPSPISKSLDESIIDSISRTEPFETYYAKIKDIKDAKNSKYRNYRSHNKNRVDCDSVEKGAKEGAKSPLETLGCLSPNNCGSVENEEKPPLAKTARPRKHSTVDDSQENNKQISHKNRRDNSPSPNREIKTKKRVVDSQVLDNDQKENINDHTIVENKRDVPKEKIINIVGKSHPNVINSCNKSRPTKCETDIDVTPLIPKEISQNIEEDIKIGKIPNKSRGERLCCNILEQIYKGHKFVTVRPDWLKNPETGRNLEIDCYNDDLKIGLEFNGEQHYKYPNRFHKNVNEFKQQVRRDRYKVETCDNNGVYLITVPWNIPEHRLKEYITFYLPENVLAREQG